MLDFRMPTISDSGICFRRLIPKIQGFGDMEQFNLRSTGGMGHLESYYFLHNGIARRMGLTPDQEPQVRHIEPEVGVWHTVKLTMQGRTFSAEYDGEVILDRFRFHDWMMSMEPAPIVLQKHMVVRGGSLGEENPCPIEYRNIFIKELAPEAANSYMTSSHAAMLPPELPLWDGSALRKESCVQFRIVTHIQYPSPAESQWRGPCDLSRRRIQGRMDRPRGSRSGDLAETSWRHLSGSEVSHPSD